MTIWLVGEFPHSLAVHCSLHALGQLCQALGDFEETKEIRGSLRKRGETAFVSDVTIKTSNPLQQDSFPSTPERWEIKKMYNFSLIYLLLLSHTLSIAAAQWRF